MTHQLLILSGIYNSGPEHWQTLWQRDDPTIQKLEHRDWDTPDCHEWVRELEHTVSQLGPDLVLVAHSLACLMVAHWAATTRLRIKAALLVSVPDPDGPAFPADAKNFSHVPLQPLPFPSIVVSSTNDPYGTQQHMEKCAKSWGSEFVSVGALGHINADSQLGNWEQGKALLQRVCRS